MTRIWNDPVDFKDQMLDGFVAAYGRFIERIPDASGVRVVGGPVADKVAVLVGGGSGHFPLFCGYVGQGLAMGAVMGDIFASPSGEQIYRCTKAVDAGKGVVYGYGNYSGDVMNFSMGKMRAEMDGHAVREIVISDDVASSPQFDRRRGIAGDFFVFKCLGASAWRGDDLDTVAAFGQRANQMTRSFGVAFGGCTLPGRSEPLFTVEPGKMELGLGLHGEPGVESSALLPGKDIARMMVERLLADAPQSAGSRAAVLLNGLGATKYEELFVLYSDIHRLLADAGIDAHKPIVGELGTSLDMAGCSLSLMWLDDDLQALFDAPGESAAWANT
ncbi:MAG: dihydroxyacetone kinase subunit DhaK [Anaerolineae bacterium]|nr:dihydroxyacetone kinase subunit DhaK [Anaerolineae bacterium]